MSEPQETTASDAALQPAVSSTSLVGDASPPGSTASQSTAAASVKSAESTRPSSLPKPSGLKPPSKIGRLCSNSAPKPAVPISPRTDGSSDAVRKLSDDLSRKHLSDLIEAEEDEVSSSLPDRPRSHRKASNHSVVLTEDTDSFIIGERVWVGGTKPGQIAYIGETQFAPGDWAGIVLDDAIGKNDGSVAGVRYFQCSEKRGVFSRLTRLTRSPLATHDGSPTSDAGSVFERPPSGVGRYRRTLSPNGSVRSVVSSKMNASISTTTNGELRLGDRVIVSSSRGSKAGTLKYVGVTEFASGVWAGVELDDPIGKNDGSVEGKRYFECAPRFGLFAPIAKVSRSPSNRKPGACAIHNNNGRMTPMRRSNSRESLTSLGTSIASSRATGVRLGVTALGAQRVGGPRASSTPVSAKNALQEMLREKQHHLERLMRERELERSEVAKVSLQANRAETALEQLKKEAAQTSTENGKLKAELDRLTQQLEDEKQRVEDLLFKHEEENINKEDYNKYKDAMEAEKFARDQRIRELEAEVALQAARADAAATTLRAGDQQRAAELAALADQHREELAAAHTLSSELQKLLDEAYALLKEKDSEKDSIGKSMSEELSKVKAEAEKALAEAKSKISIAQTEFDTQISVLTAKLQLAESKLESEKQNLERLNKENSQTVIDLNAKLAQLQASVDDKTHELNKVIGASKEHELNLNKEITKLKMELSSKILDLEQLEEAKTKQDSGCKVLQEEIAKVREEHAAKVNEYESLLNEITQQNEKSKSDIAELQQSLAAKTREYEKLLHESSDSSSSTEQLINEYKQNIHERDKEIIKLKDDYEQATANFNIKHSKIAEEHKKEIDNRNSKIEELMKEIENHKQTLDQNKVELDTLNSQFTHNADELKAAKEENERLKQQINELTQVNNELKDKMSALILEIGELKRQLASTLEKCEDLQKSKDKIEGEYMNLTGQATDSNEQFNKLSQHLKESEKALEEFKDKAREAANIHGRMEQELKQQLFKLQEDFSLERGQLVKSNDERIEELKLADSKIKELENQSNEISNHMKELESKADQLMDENTNLRQEIVILKTREQELNNEYEIMCKKVDVDIEKYKEEIAILKADGATSQVTLMEKVDQLTEAQNELNNKLEEARKNEDSLQKVINDMNLQLGNQKSQYEKELEQVHIQLSAVSDELKTSRGEGEQLKQSLQEKENSIKELSRKLEMLDVDLKSNLEIVTEKERQIAQINGELNGALESKKQLEEKLNASTLEYSTLKQQYEAFASNSSAEESVLREQLNQLESLRKEMAVLNQDKNTIETKYQEGSAQLEKLRTEHEETLKKLNENITANANLNKALEEQKSVIQNENQKSENNSTKVKHLEDEISRLSQEIQTCAAKENELNSLNENLNKAIAELKIQNEELNEKYKVETESLKNTVKPLQNRVEEQDKQLEELQHAKERVTELQQIIAKSESDIKQLTSINEGQKTNYEDLNKQLQKQYEEYKKEAKRAKHDLKAQVEMYDKELKESKEKVKVEMEKQYALQKKLSDAENNIVELNNKLELVTVQQSASVEKDDKLEKLTLELQAIRKTTSEALSKNETTINALKNEVEQRKIELKQKQELITKLQEDVKNLKAKAEIAEREKVLMMKNMASKKDIRDKNDNNAIGLHGAGDVPAQNVEQQAEMEGQVSFLNSVIVDMQRKNEMLLARVQVLEGGAPDEPVFNGRKPRAVAPRLWCDICDVFDAHDTEECPRQAAGAPPDAPAAAAGKKPPPPPRPYCDICEVFGHATENCDEEETF
ncbi:CAP-Gly domain-containing linker protein 2 isoform X3 [Cydia splendana]|uniref:CAP-Gly domain-containing linker protein 2 isoform X3 n=1 Tax=Cydia splendana TaxID=1100963 RepID=UPI00300D2B15